MKRFFRKILSVFGVGICAYCGEIHFLKSMKRCTRDLQNRFLGQMLCDGCHYHVGLQNSCMDGTFKRKLEDALDKVCPDNVPVLEEA